MENKYIYSLKTRIKHPPGKISKFCYFVASCLRCTQKISKYSLILMTDALMPLVEQTLTQKLECNLFCFI